MTASAGAANPLIQQATDKVNSIESKVQEFFGIVNDALSWVPDFLSHLIEPIQKGMKLLQQKIQDFWERVSKLWEQPGHSSVLKAVSDQWPNDVGNPVGSTAGDVELHNLRTNIEWKGRAAAAYKAIVPAQGEGLKSIKDLSLQLGKSLKSLADSIDAFWRAITIAFATLLVGMVGAVVGAATLAGIPAAITFLVATLTVAVATIGQAVSAVETHIDIIGTEQSTIMQKIHDLGTEWDKSSVDLSDASISDGDGSNWRVRP